MRIAYLDCFAGISGDMFLGALLDCGVPRQVLDEACVSLDIGASLTVETVDRAGIRCAKVTVLEGGQPAESPGGDSPQKQHSPANSLHPSGRHTHYEAHSKSAEPGRVNTPHPKGRSLSHIQAIIAQSSLAPQVQAFALHTFEALGASEARIHNIAVDQVHFHEVGAVDAIVDIVCVSAGIAYLGAAAWYSSPINQGSGMVQCAHGNFPVPAPATADLLRGLPSYSAHLDLELTTPTGAALVRTLNPVFGTQPAMKVDTIGYGAGSRNPTGFPNTLRLSLGESEPVSTIDHTQIVAVLETALDDSSPQVLAYVAERALALGALDIMLTPVIMKKGRPGTLLTLLCTPADSAKFQQLLLTETSTLGVRVRHDQRLCLERHHVTVQTPFGPIRIKVGSTLNHPLTATPEFEDCRAAAIAHNIPLKQVQQESLASFHSHSHDD